MKKAVLLLVSSFLLILFSGCAQKEVLPEEDEMIIEVDISEINDPVYRLDISYFLDDELMGGMAVSNTDTTEYKGPAYFVFLPENFPENGNLENFSFKITVSGDKNGINDLFSSSELMDSTEACEQFRVEYGKLHHYKVTGSFEEGFKLEKN